MSLFSSFVRMPELNTTDANSAWEIRGNLMALTISPPRIRLFRWPVRVCPCFTIFLVAHWSIALKRSTSLTFNVLLFTTDLTTDISTVENPSDINASSACISISFQHSLSNSFASNFSAATRIWKTFDTSKMSRKYLVHLFTSEGTMYCVAKFNTCITLLPLKFTLS